MRRYLGAISAASWRTWRAKPGVSALALWFLILTAARTVEVLGATWSEIVLSGPDAPLWTVPGTRIKAGKEHRIPLSDAAVAVLREAKVLRETGKPEEPIVPGQRAGMGLSNTALLMLLRRTGRGDLTGHGFRSIFRDWCAEATYYPRELAEAALAHAVRDRTEAAYQRGPMMEKRRVMMDAWSGFGARPMATGEVVAFRPAAG